MKLSSVAVVLTDLVPPWLAMGLFRVEFKWVGEFGRAFRAATVLVTKSASFHPVEEKVIGRVGGRRWESGDRRWESGDRRWESGDRRWE